MKIIWTTDIHLDHAPKNERERFYTSIRTSGANALVLCGDLSNGFYLRKHLDELAEQCNYVNLNVYFVLGNHDFYGSSISSSRRIALDRVSVHESLYYLTKMDTVYLSEEVVLIGHDGWYDTRNGHVGSVIMNDFKLIEDFNNFPTRDMMDFRFKELAQEAADHFLHNIQKAFKTHRKVILATHVAPFPEASWYDGRHSNIDFMPYFSSKIEGTVLMEIMENHPDHELLVLCGHSHGKGMFQAMNNLKVLTGGANYGSPLLQKEIFDV